MIEQLIFITIAVALFVTIFFKMFKKNDTSYIGILIIEAVGIAIDFIVLVFDKQINMFFRILVYVISIVIPLIVIILEKMNINILGKMQILKAKLFLLLGKDKKAKDALLEIVDKNPKSYEAHRLLAEMYELEGGIRKAIDEYVQSIELNKQDYDSYYKVAILLTDLEKNDEAMEMLSNLLDKKPDYYNATIALGDMLIEKEMYKEAVLLYNDALKYNPGSYDLNYNLGIVYTMLNDFQSAKMYYEKAAEINSLMHNLKYNLAEIALIYKELDKAEMYFQELLEEEEISADAYLELAKIKLLKGEKEIAIKYANLSIEIDPKGMAEKVKKDSIFIPIMAKIAIPFNIPEEEKSKKMSKKELKAKKHLEEMSEKTRNLGNSDISLLKQKINKEKQNSDIQKEKE